MLARYNLSVTSQGVLPDPAAWQAATVAAFTQQLNATAPPAGCPPSARAGNILTQLLISVRAPAGNWSSGSQAPPLIITNISGAALALDLQQQQQQAAPPPHAAALPPPPGPPPSTSTSTREYTWWWILLVFVALFIGAAAGAAGIVWWTRRRASQGAQVVGLRGGATSITHTFVCENCGTPGQLQPDSYTLTQAAGGCSLILPGPQWPGTGQQL